MTRKNTKKDQTGNPRDNDAKITLDGIDKDLSGVIAVVGPDTPAFFRKLEYIRAKLDIPEQALGELLDYRFPKPEGIFFCPVCLTEETIKTAWDAMLRLSDRYGKQATLILIHEPDLYEELPAKLEQLKADAVERPEEAVKKHMEFLDLYTDRMFRIRTIKDNMRYMWWNPAKIPGYHYAEPIEAIRNFLSKFHARKLIKTEEWKADLLARKDLVKVLPDKDSPLPEKDGMADILHLTDLAPLDRSTQDLPLGRTKKWLEGRIESYEDSHGFHADRNLTRRICEEIACIQSIPTVYAKQPDTAFPMVLPNCTFPWDKALKKDRTEIREKLKPFLTLAGNGPADMTKWACALKSMMEPAGSAGCGIYLACGDDARLLIHAGLNPLFWYQTDQPIQSRDYAVTVRWLSMTKKELSEPGFRTDAERDMLGTPDACNHVTVFSGPDVPSCRTTDRILKLPLMNDTLAGQTKTQKKAYAEYLANLSGAYVTPVIAEWVKKLSFDRASGTYFGIRELIAGKLPDNPLLNPGNLPVSGIAEETE